MVRYICTTIILLLTVSVLSAQQEEQFTQFMYYKQGINPGYAGSDEALTVTALARNQWLGLDGAPQTQLISVVAPVLNQRIGVGANILRQSIGVTDLYTLDGLYTYRLKVPRGFLGIGIQASVRMLRVDFSNLRGTQSIAQDQAVPDGIQSKFVPNFGTGLYYQTRSFYLGFSIPRLLTTNIDLSNDGDVIAREVTHAYLMAGGVISLGEQLALQPQVLLKYVKGAPFDGDVNLNLLIADKFSTGVSYRIGGSKASGIGEAISVLLGIQLSKNILFGISYDATVSELRKYNSGTIEGMFRYTLGGGGGEEETEEVENPRYFN